ncbi:MAG: DEAD/DEAH box helicase [Aliishimia sp.]
MKQTLQAALDARGYDKLTPVQEAVLAPELQDCDLLVSAQTGSGKTLGFGLAIAPTILRDADMFDAARAPLALVIAPTRELAMQVKRELSWLFAQAGAILTSCVGGMDMRDERRALSRGAHIVVATPGRLRDHIMRGSIDLSALRAVVLDEADEMLDLGFREDLEFILGEAPEDRQTLLFSATVSKPIARLAENYQTNAKRVVTKSETAQHADIDYRAMVVGDRDTDNAVINTLRFYEAPNALVFANTRAMVNRLTTRLSNRGFQVVALSGELSQSERTHALQAMRDGRAQVCVATDVAARGIDLPNLDLVVHAELPNNHETLLHRSGRTGRAGRKGVSALIVNKKSRRKAERILQQAKLKADWTGAPSADDVRESDENRMFADPSWHEPISEAATAGVAKLVDAFTPEQLANAYLALYHSQRTAPDELSDVDAKPAPRQEFGESVWFSISLGHDDDAEPRRLLPMLCKAGDMTKDDIGAIRVRQSQSFVQIKKSTVPSFLAAVGADMVLEEGAKLAQLAQAPDLGEGRGGGKPGGGPRKGPRHDKGKFDKPRGDKPRGDKPYSDKPRSDKPKYDKAGGAKSYDAKPKGKPDSSPIDWDDAPAPRRKKPKTDGAAGAAKPRHKAADTSRRMERAVEDGAVSKPRKAGGAAGAKPAGKPFNKTGDKPKGPPPPKGKSNSKKNQARAAARKAIAKTSGANSKPKRPKA